jgi:hypothetical protein
MNYQSKAKLVMNKLDIRDMYYKLPILLDEYHNILDVAECIFSGSNSNSAGKDKKGVSKGNHLQLIGSFSSSERASVIYFLRRQILDLSNPRSIPRMLSCMRGIPSDFRVSVIISIN